MYTFGASNNALFSNRFVYPFQKIGMQGSKFSAKHDRDLQIDPSLKYDL